MTSSLSADRFASLHGRAQLTPSVSVRSLRDVEPFADALAAELVDLLTLRFDDVDAAMVSSIVDAALSRMVTVDPDRTPGFLPAADPESVSLRFAEVVYAAVRQHHAGNEKLTAEWGFSGFYQWFAVVAAQLLGGPTGVEAAGTLEASPA